MAIGKPQQTREKEYTHEEFKEILKNKCDKYEYENRAHKYYWIKNNLITSIIEIIEPVRVYYLIEGNDKIRHICIDDFILELKIIDRKKFGL